MPNKLLVIVCYLLIAASAAAQAIDSSSTRPIPADTTLRIIFTKTETPAAFPGGPKAWTDFLIDNLNSDVAANNGAPVGTYHVVVRFVVLTDGSVRNVVAVTGLGYGMELELRRLLYTTPKWIPAVQNGHKVDSYVGVPVTFVVEE